MRSGAIFTALAVAGGISLGLLSVGLFSHQAFAADDVAQASQPIHAWSASQAEASSVPAESKIVAAHPPRRVDFERESASKDAHAVADWVLDSGDNRSMPFVIVDKTEAKVFIFTADGRLSGAAPALLGLARGDDAVPGIGDREMSSIRPEERTTPAGRFVSSLGRNLRGKEILWVDYDTAISMHPVITSNPKEHRAQRLATPTPLDNRISYGCINVTAKFYENVVHPAFAGTNGIVYVLPETRLPREVFGSYDVEEHARMQARKQALSIQVGAEVALH